MLKRLTINRRIMAGFLVVLILFIGVAGINIINARSTSALTDAIVRDDMHADRLILELDKILSVNVTQTISAAQTDDLVYEKYLVSDNLAGSRRATEIFAELKESVVEPEAMRRLEAITVARAEYLRARTAVFAMKASSGVEQTRTYIDQQFKPVSVRYLAARTAPATRLNIRNHFWSDELC